MISERQLAFCREYVVDYNGQAAAERAGYKKSAARVTASQLLARPDIKEIVRGLTEEKKLNSMVTAERVIEELAAIAYAKTSDFVKVRDMVFREKDAKGKYRSRRVRVAYVELTKDIPEEKQRAIAEIRQTKDGIAIKAHDKTKALELLGRHLGLFEKDNQQRKPVVNLGDAPVEFK